VRVLAFCRISSFVFQACKKLYMGSASTGDCYFYYVVLFLCIFACLAMCHSRVFGFSILKILNRCVFRVFHAWKNLYVGSLSIGDCPLYHAVLFLFTLARLDMRHIRVFGLGIFAILSRWQFWRSLGSPSAFFTRERCLPWQYVDWRLSPIWCSLLPLQPCTFRDAPYSRFWSRDLWYP